MAKMPQVTQLPDLRNPDPRDQRRGYDDYEHRSRAQSRVDLLEDRLSMQERNTQVLLDRAFKIKEDILDNLNYTHGTWQGEKRARELLQDHIKTITDLVKRLDKDIKGLEDEIRARRGESAGAASAVKNLEVHHVAGLTDLRGRVARCDASIAKLAGDLKSCFDAIRQLSQEQQENNARMVEKLQNIDSKMASISNQLDKANTEQTMKIKHIEGDSAQQYSFLDSKTKTIVDELRTSMQSIKMLGDSEREKLEARMTTHIDRTLMDMDGKIDKIRKKLDENRQHIDVQLAKIQEQVSKEKERGSRAEQELEYRVTHQIDTSLRHPVEEVAKLKRECREGFASIHDSVTNMKSVQDGKRKLLEEQLRKEIGQIRKMVVLL